MLCKVCVEVLSVKHIRISKTPDKYNKAARDVIKDSNNFRFDDLYKVAQVHANRIAASSIETSPLLFIDTDVYITRSYARFMFKKNLELPHEIIEHNKAALYLYLNNDVPHVQDGTCLGEADRNKLDYSHRMVLAENDIEYNEIKGDWQERFEQSINIIKSQFGV